MGELKDKEMRWKDKLIAEFGSVNWAYAIQPFPFPFFSGAQTSSPQGNPLCTIITTILPVLL